MKTKTELLDEVKQAALNCKGCILGCTRQNLVFADGSPDAPVMLIGEAPGADEDSAGRPFVGRAGKLLNQFLEEAHIVRQKDLYISNIAKCRPPKNRKPLKEEKKACKCWLEKQIEIVKPKAIILCGATAMEAFINEKITISKARGRIFIGENGIKLAPIFHPSFLLRNYSTKEGSPRDLMKKDLKQIRDLFL